MMSREREGVLTHRQLDCLLNNRENIITGPLLEESIGGWIPAQRASNVEGVSMQWPHHEEYESHKNLDSRTFSKHLSINPLFELSWWRYQNGNIFRVTGHLCGESPVTGEFPAQRPVTRSFDIFFDLHLNKWLSEQSWGWWFETPYIVPIMTSQ